MLRRAVILSLLEDKAEHLIARESKHLKVDEGTLRGFLECKDYKHGVRSMEAIIQMSTLLEWEVLMCLRYPQEIN